MEFLTTPDLGRWPSATPNPRPKSTPVNPLQQTPAHLPTPSPIPAQRLPFQTPVDRAGIKNSFQALFSPNAATPAFYRPNNEAPGLTPFLGPLPTPNVIAPGSTLMSFRTASASASQPHPHATPGHENPLSSPYLAAAAKEAVRREFMNMPSFVHPDPSAAPSAEHVVPGREVPHAGDPSAASPAHVPSASSPTRHVSPSSGDAKVPTSVSRPREGDEAKGGATANEAAQQAGPAKDQAKDAARMHPVPPGQAHPHPQGVQPGMSHVQPFFMPPGHAPPPGMMMMGQHPGQMMMSAPAPGMYAPPGMFMFAGQPGFGAGMMMAPPPGHPVRQQPAVKPETQAEKKLRIEHEKQELIREFKKKTREAALVRFRQKRRERRFGKLIRYDCRKKLADARPRVKGRFVRIKDEEDDESAQVVPGFSR